MATVKQRRRYCTSLTTDIRHIAETELSHLQLEYNIAHSDTAIRFTFYCIFSYQLKSIVSKHLISKTIQNEQDSECRIAIPRWILPIVE